MENLTQTADSQTRLTCFSGALTAPRETWQAYAQRDVAFVQTYLQLALPMVLVTAVVTALLGWVLGTQYGGGFGGMLRQMLLVGAAGAVALPINGAIFGGLAGAFGGRSSPSAGLAAVTLALVPGFFGQMLGTLPWIGWLLALVLGIYSLVLLYKSVPVFLQVEGGKRPLHFILALVCCIVVGVVISKPMTALLGSPAYVASEQARSADTAGKVFGAMFGEQAGKDVQLMTQALAHEYTPPGAVHNLALYQKNAHALNEVMRRY